MIEIKQSRKLHESGYRLMTVTSDGQIISECSDVIRINIDRYRTISLDITKQGIIRLFSSSYNFKVIPEQYSTVEVNIESRY